jgi:2-polyprenyl-3-methyl-5-hydroxy-6-metoxy-1,4-benzoquinol methylase/glycosyltransferase involved in cell wall biosynthesis
MDVVETLDKMNLSTKIFYSVPQVELDVAMVVRSLKNGGQSEMPPKPASQLEWTGERYLPWLDEATIGYEHLHRYAYATQFVDGKRVLDLACGEGYGSQLLARTARDVVGIDIDVGAVRHASNKYLRRNLEFRVGSITAVPVEGQNLFDVIVCFEALEHIADHHALLKEIKRLLTPDGVFIVSTPNKWAYSDEPQYTNPFHVHELYFGEFRELLKKYFRQVKMLGQRVYCNSHIWPVFPSENSKLADYVIERNPQEFAFVECNKKIPLYFIALASDGGEELSENTSVLVDSSNQLLKEKDVRVNIFAVERDAAQRTIRTHQQRLAEIESQLEQITAERDRWGQEEAGLRARVQSQEQTLVEKESQLVEKESQLVEKERQLVEKERLLVEADHQAAELLAIKDTIGWRALSKYRAVRERFGIIKFLHFALTQPVKRIYKKKNNQSDDAITSTAAGVSLLSAGGAERIRNQLLCETLVSASAVTGLPEVQKHFFRRLGGSKAGSAATVLFLADWLPAFDRAGGGLRAFSMLQILNEGGHNLVYGANRNKPDHVYFFGSEEDVKKYQQALEQLGIAVLYGSSEILRYLTEEGQDCKFVVLSFPEVAYRYFPSVRAHAMNAEVIYDPVDLHWLRMERESGIKHDDALRRKAEDYRRMERFNAAAADIVFAVTHEEKTRILEDVPNAKIEVIPTIHSPVDKVKPAAARKNLLFVGHYAHTPNEDAVSYFVQDIFPLIRKELPGVIFYMVGSHITERVKSLAARGVVAVGYVADLSPYLDDCRVFVAPLRYGAGIKAKIGHSMSFGLPVVTTSLGAEGMNLTSGKHALIADSATAFASAVVRLYTDDLLWEEISTNSLMHIKTHFSNAIAKKKLEQVFAAESDSLRSIVAEVG